MELLRDTHWTIQQQRQMRSLWRHVTSFHQMSEIPRDSHWRGGLCSSHHPLLNTFVVDISFTLHSSVKNRQFMLFFIRRQHESCVTNAPPTGSITNKLVANASLNCM